MNSNVLQAGFLSLNLHLVLWLHLEPADGHQPIADGGERVRPPPMPERRSFAPRAVRRDVAVVEGHGQDKPAADVERVVEPGRPVHAGPWHVVVAHLTRGAQAHQVCPMQNSKDNLLQTCHCFNSKLNKSFACIYLFWYMRNAGYFLGGRGIHG